MLHWCSNIWRRRKPHYFCPSTLKLALAVVSGGTALPDYGSSAKELPDKLIRAFWSAPQHSALIAEPSLAVCFRTDSGEAHPVCSLFTIRPRHAVSTAH